MNDITTTTDTHTIETYPVYNRDELHHYSTSATDSDGAEVYGYHYNNATDEVGAQKQHQLVVDRLHYDAITAGNPTVKKFSACGSCITLGVLLRETAKFYVYVDVSWSGTAERKIAKRTAHVDHCHSCRGGSNYPN